MNILKKLVAVIVILALVNIGFIWYGQTSFDATVKTLAKAFAENNETTPRSNKRLPDPLLKYIDESKAKEHSYKTLVLQLEGEYRSRPKSKWAQMHALALLRPSCDMLWAIRLESNPIVTFNALETYHGAKATMEMLLFGIIPTGKREGEKFARSELARVLAYSVYNPLLFEREGVEFTQLDANRVEAVAKDGNISASVTFLFNPKGEIVEVQSKDRLRPVKGGLQPAFWRMKILSYREVDGIKIPENVEEHWVIEGNEFPYLRAKVDMAKRL